MKLGSYLIKRSENKAEISRRAGISKSGLGRMTSNDTPRLHTDELYLIALAMDNDPCEMFNDVSGHLKIKR